MARGVFPPGPWHVTTLVGALLWALVSVGADGRLIAWSGDFAGQSGDITVRGCVMKDAASRVPLYKLLEDAPGTRVFRLTFPKEIDVAAQVGHTVDATGAVVATTGSHDPGLALKKLTVVRDSCSSPDRPAGR